MKLSDVDSGNYAVVNNINGSTAYVKRVTEMGFVKGRKIFVVKNAPLRDPIEYDLMGYSVSLRRKEAELIDVSIVESSEDELECLSVGGSDKNEAVMFYERLDNSGTVINVALVGNPNCGKTTLFNFMSNSDEHVGNYSGVTVDSKVASLTFKGYTINITDLPGTYSLNTYSPEEIIVRDRLINEKYDFVINVVDATVLERNLFLTTQLIDMGCEVIVALNMYDEFQNSGDVFDHKTMSKLLAVPFVPSVAKKGRGVAHILDEIVHKYQNGTQNRVKIETNLGRLIEEKIKSVELLLPNDNIVSVSKRFSAIMLLERNDFFCNIYDSELVAKCEKFSKELESEYKNNIISIFADARYGFISGALNETLTINSDRYKKSRKIDNILTDRVWGFPFFITIMWLIFYATFTLGAYPQQGIEYLIGLMQSGVAAVLSEGILRDLLIDGIIGGVGSVALFLPNILLLFLFISILEDSGYMARAAFIMDKLMHKIGLHGKSFIPLVMGFGCNVPAIMASRIIEDKSNRLLTILIMPFMSCSARLPVYMLIVTAFFPEHGSLVLFGIYLFGILIAIISSIIFKKVLFKAKDQPFVMELPPYRIPSTVTTLKHMWSKGAQYIQKMAGVILVAVMIIWSLSYFPDKENSYLKTIGKTIEPVVAPLGFDWKIGVGLISGVAAKEIIVSTMGVLNQVDAEGDDGEFKLAETLKNDKYSDGERRGEYVFTTPVALSFLAFVLIYFPCIAVVSAVKRETGMWKWAAFVVVYTTSLAWIVSYGVYNLFS